MKRLLAFMAVALIALLSAASTALAHDNNRGGRGDDNEHGEGNGKGHQDRSFKCNGTFTGMTITSDVVVPPNASCTLINSTVKGDVEVRANAYFQATKTSIREDVRGQDAQTVFIDTGSSVGGDVGTDKTAQVFVFNSTINGSIGIYRASDTIDICGNTVKGEGIGIARSGRDILVGDPLTVDCAGNTVTRGSVLITQNNTDVELVVRGNSILKGTMYVLDNTGPSSKFVQGNLGGKTLRCTGNGAPFVGASNPGWQQRQGQCSA
jgi:hypothetical protein